MTPSDAVPVEALKNIGEVTTRWLHAAGIHTEDELREAGALLAYKILQRQQPTKATVLLLYALHGALEDISWSQLSAEVKARLRSEAEGTLVVE